MDSGEFSNETADYERKITRAVIEGDVEKLRELCNTLPRDFNVNFMIKCLNTTVLMNAVMMNDYPSAEILCRHGADVNLGTYDSYKAIHWVCEKQNNPQMLKLLINHGANIDENWLYGERAIHLALKHSRTENVEVLLDAGADISGCIRLDNEQYLNISTLCLAALKCPNLVPKFLKQGADPNDDLSTCGSSVLGLMLENNGDKETVKAVIQAGACITKGCRGKTAIECCKNLGQIFAFLESGVPVSEIESQLKDSLIAMAILEDFCEATVYENILKLISFGAIPNGTETFKDSALILSIKKHFWEIVDILIAQGADLNHKGEGGNTALHVCCQNVAFLDNYKVMITQLCTAGADVNVMNDDRLTPLLILMMQMSPAEFPTSNDRHEDKSLISCLLNYGANVNVVLPTTSESTLHFACMQGDFETAKMLIKAGYDVNKCETNGEAPIFAFFPLDSARETSVVNMLLENGASANVLDKGGTSLLERVFKQLKSTYSSFRDEMEPREDLIEKLTSILLQLLLNEADPNLATPGQDSVLIQAIQTPGMDDVVSALVEAGADVCHIGRNKMTTFEACCLNDEIENLGENQLRILSLIIEANFPLNEPLSDGRYPLQLVMDYTNTDAIIQDMLSKGADPNKYKEGGEPPLVLSLYRNPSVTYALIEAGADTSVKSNEGISVIKLFCEKVFYDEQYCCLPNSQSTRLIIDHFEFAKSKVELEQRTNLAEDTTKRTPMETTSGEMKPFSGKEKILTKKRSQKLSEQQRKCESNICCEIIKILIEKNNENVNIKTPCGLAPLCVAVKLGSHSLIDYLLEKKADPNCMKLMNESLLFFALIRGNEDIIKGLIKAGANVNHCTVLPGTGEKQSLLNRFLDENGEFSKASNLVNLVQILIENGASVNECEEGFASPLIKAVRLSSFELVDLLLRQGANVNHHGKNGFTALHECCIKGKFEVEDPNTEIFNLLLGAGASVNSQASSVNTPVTGIYPDRQNKEGTTCLMLAVSNYSLIKQLLDIGADPTVQDQNGNTVLHHLCSTTLKRKKKGEILELLLKSVTDINVLNHEGYTPLNLMIKEKTNLNVEDVQDLLMQKAGPNICLKGCNSPLINSLLRCKLDVASYLLKAGGDVKHEGKSGLTALHAVLNLELTSGYITGRIEMIQKLLAAGSDVNKRELEGNTGLMFCLKSSCKRRKDEVLPVIEFLLEAGADPNISDISGGRPLEIIIKSLSKSRNETKIQELVEMMFLYGAKCNEYEKGQDSVLHMAVSNGLQGVVQILVNRGADVNHRGKHQQIPLHRYFSSENKDELYDPWLPQAYVKSKSQKILDILLPLTRDPNIEDENGDSPLNLACACLASKNKDDIRKLLQAGADPLHKGQGNVDAFEKCIATENLRALEILLLEKGSNHITDLHFTAFLNVSQIHDAKLYQRVALLMLNTNKHINVNRRNSKGDTPFDYFCYQNATDVIRKLMERGADVTATARRNILHVLCDSPDIASKLDTISLIIKSNADLDVQDTSGKTVLQKTVEKYRKFYLRDGYSTYKCIGSIIEHLLNAGAKCIETELTSLLQLACKHQHFALMKALVRRGADLSVKKSERGILHDCWLPFDFYKIVITPNLLKECIEYIEFHKKAGGSLTELYKGSTPLDLYLKSDIYKKSENFKSLRDEIATLLACNDEDVCESDRRLSEEHIAASTGHLSKLKTLVEKGANLHLKDKDENSCLHLCLSSGIGSVVEMVSYLLEQGLSPNDTNSDHETPLYLILKNAKYHTEDEVSSIVKLLIKFGGNPNQEKLEKNPLIQAIETFNAKCVHILLKNGARVNDLPSKLNALHVMYDSILSVLVKDQREDIRFLQHLLVTNQVNLNAKNTCGDSVLHLAVKVLCNTKISVGATQLIQELVEHGSDVNATDCNGQTALSLCCEFGCDIECIAVSKYLLENGADPNTGCALNRAFMHVKCGIKDETKELIFQLLSHGANPNAETDCSDTPNLIVAINMGDTDLVNALLKNGAHPNIWDDSETSLLYACNLGFDQATEIVPLLLRYGCSINLGQHGKPYIYYRQHPLFRIVEKIIKNAECVEFTEEKYVEKVDLRLFNLLLCGGCDLSVLLRPGNKGKSILASLTRNGYFKAAETLIRCGYNFKVDSKFQSIDFSEVDISTFRSEYGYYQRANYESEVEKFQEMLKRIEEPQLTLQSLCRRALRQHLVFVNKGSEIESLISTLPLSEVLKNYLTLRDYTQDFEKIEFYEEI